MPQDWRVVVITDETIQWPTLLVPPELREAYEMWIAAERALLPVQEDDIRRADYTSLVRFRRSEMSGSADQLFIDTLTFGELAITGNVDLTETVPEPATIAIGGLSIIALMGVWRRRRR